MPTKRKFLSMAAAFASATLPAWTASAQQPINLRLGIVINVDSTLGGEFVKTFAEQAEKKSNGRLRVRIFDKGQLGGETEMIANIRIGNLDMAAVNAATLGSVESSFVVTELPFVWRTREQAHQALDGEVGAELRRRIEAKKIKVLAAGEWGYRALLTRNRSVNTLSDLKGLKVRVAENPISVATWRAVGTNPVPMSWTEVYTGFQQGSIDAVESNPTGFRDAKLYEVAKHLVRTNHSFTSLALIVNLDVWNSLPPDLQKIAQEAALAGQQMNRQRAYEANEEAIAFMKQNGVTVTSPDLAPFRKAVQGVYDQFANQVGPDLVKKVIEAGK